MRKGLYLMLASIIGKGFGSLLRRIGRQAERFKRKCSQKIGVSFFSEDDIDHPDFSPLRQCYGLWLRPL